MTLKEKIEAFEKLGIFLDQFHDGERNGHPPMPWLEVLNSRFFRTMVSIIDNSQIHNPWFTRENINHALGSIGRNLKAEAIVGWLSCYGDIQPPEKPKTVAVIMAGNIPLVGFHDLLCVLFSGHNILIKLSVRDDLLLKLLAEILIFLNQGFKDRISFAGGRIEGFDAVIATGSDNTSRYFEYYFGKYPCIIRKNRNSAAIIDGTENTEDLKLLSNDVFRYFGLGCRSVSKLFVPLNYDFNPLLGSFSGYSHLINHNQWANNYEYQKAVHLIDKTPHLDSGFLIIRENKTLSSPIAVLNYETVSESSEAMEIIAGQSDELQCVVGSPKLDGNLVPFGRSQEPGLKDYADNIDTIEFLLNL